MAQKNFPSSKTTPAPAAGVGAAVVAWGCSLWTLIIPPLALFAIPVLFLVGLVSIFASRQGPCPHCGAKNVFTPLTRKLKCTDCGHRLALRGKSFYDLTGGTLDRAPDSREPASAGGNVSADSSSNVDKVRWDALLRYDKEVAAAADQVRPLGQKWIDELARAVLALNDTKYLPGIIEKINERAQAERAETESRLAREEAKREAEALQKERLLFEAREKYGRFLFFFWGTSRRRDWTVGSAAIAFLVVWAYVEVVKNMREAAVSQSSPRTVVTTREAIRPSFDCASIHSKVLKLVCARPELASLDQKLANTYEAALHAATSQQNLRADERAWIRKRNKSNPDEIALRKMYSDRIAYLSAIVHRSSMSSTPIPASAGDGPNFAPSFSDPDKGMFAKGLVKVRDDWAGCTEKETLDRFNTIAQSGDEAAIAQFMREENAAGFCEIMSKDTWWYADQSDLWNGKICLRAPGNTLCFWTNSDKVKLGPDDAH